MVGVLRYSGMTVVGAQVPSYATIPSLVRSRTRKLNFGYMQHRMIAKYCLGQALTYWVLKVKVTLYSFGQKLENHAENARKTLPAVEEQTSLHTNHCQPPIQTTADQPPI